MSRWAPGNQTFSRRQRSETSLPRTTENYWWETSLMSTRYPEDRTAGRQGNLYLVVLYLSINIRGRGGSHAAWGYSGCIGSQILKYIFNVPFYCFFKMISTLTQDPWYNLTPESGLKCSRGFSHQPYPLLIPLSCSCPVPFAYAAVSL